MVLTEEKRSAATPKNAHSSLVRATQIALVLAQAICKQAGFRVASGKVFTVDWLWHGWAVRAHRTASEAGLAPT